MVLLDRYPVDVFLRNRRSQVANPISVLPSGGPDSHLFQLRSEFQSFFAFSLSLLSKLSIRDLETSSWLSQSKKLTARSPIMPKSVQIFGNGSGG
jgi:hypothetical protein